MIPPATARPYERVALHVLQIRSNRYRRTGIDVPTFRLKRGWNRVVRVPPMSLESVTRAGLDENSADSLRKNAEKVRRRMTGEAQRERLVHCAIVIGELDVEIVDGCLECHLRTDRPVERADQQPVLRCNLARDDLRPDAIACTRQPVRSHDVDRERIVHPP